METVDTLESGASKPAEIRPRKWWLAAVMSMYLPGLGHLYVGRPGWLILPLVLYGLRPLAESMLVGASLGVALAGAYVSIGGTLLIYLVAIIDSARLALKEQRYELQPYNQVVAYLVIYMIFGAGLRLVQAGFVDQVHWKVTDSALQPQLDKGDYLLVEPVKAASRSSLSVGDVVVLKIGGEKEQLQFKTALVRDVTADNIVVFTGAEETLPLSTVISRARAITISFKGFIPRLSRFGQPL